MGWRFSQSIRLAEGVRLSLGKKATSLSVRWAWHHNKLQQAGRPGGISAFRRPDSPTSESRLRLVSLEQPRTSYGNAWRRFVWSLLLSPWPSSAASRMRTSLRGYRLR
jgi:hypothetical protein